MGNQLCWRCKNACGGCSWSSRGKPVKGWKATPSRVKRGDGTEGYTDTYRIKECPLFEDDTHFYAKPQRAVRKKGPPEEIKAQIRAMRKSGAKYSDICEVTGASSTAVHKVLKESGMVRGYGQIYKKTLRVTDSERARIRKLYDKGLTQHKVAAMTGRSIPTVRKVLREYEEE